MNSSSSDVLNQKQYAIKSMIYLLLIFFYIILPCLLIYHKRYPIIFGYICIVCIVLPTISPYFIPLFEKILGFQLSF